MSPSVAEKAKTLGGKIIHVRKIGSDYCIFLIQGTAQFPSLFAVLSKKFPEDDANKWLSASRVKPKDIPEGGLQIEEIIARCQSPYGGLFYLVERFGLLYLLSEVQVGKKTNGFIRNKPHQIEAHLESVKYHGFSKLEKISHHLNSLPTVGTSPKLLK